MANAGADVGVVTFPGSNGDHDALYAFQVNLGIATRLVDYRETDLDGFAALVIPGGFSYGDYLRPGAIARFAPVMSAIQEFAERGGPVLGICNGFQILTEAHLLPGALLRNRTLRFHCFRTHVRVQSRATAWTQDIAPGTVLELPVAHGDGAYFADDETLDRLEERGGVVLRYCEPDGTVTEAANRNGSVRNIAGITNERGNVVAMMPHPERAADPAIGGTDGLLIIRHALNFIHAAV